MKELLADKIRKYCNETRIIPARAKGEKTVNKSSLLSKMILNFRARTKKRL